MREERYSKHDAKNPSFSSSLLDEICRSIDDGEPKHEQLRFHGEIMPRKLKGGASGIKIEGEEGMPDLQRACLIEKFMEQKVSQKVMITQQRRQNLTEFERKSQLDHDLDQDAIFSSSTSTSSDSSSGGLSSSDTESMYGGIPRGIFFQSARGPSQSGQARRFGSGKTERTLFYEQREVHMFDDYHYNSASEQTPTFEENFIKSKSRAFKIYSNLKKMKQPISPGSKLASFLNSLFTTGEHKEIKEFTFHRKL
ncbi:hypothetical protein OIU84_000370 [Salix udensis]|uniref:Protein BIG GRAIN 1-like B n=1 Tax=Salix udensis TaxID=889485 RepID=A0AAD6PMB4_9ROSI|nr:hypothetical protein OIU84_000370 [Salix udensis]